VDDYDDVDGDDEVLELVLLPELVVVVLELAGVVVLVLPVVDAALAAVLEDDEVEVEAALVVPVEAEA
jgi:hypothetical protein